MAEETLSVEEFIGIEELEELAQSQPDNVDVQRRWAWSLLRTNHSQRAKEVLEAAAKKAPKDPELWYAMGVVLLRVNELDGAKEAFKKVNTLLADRAHESPRLTMLNHMATTHIKKMG
jgi:Flp pilus assembly protein TadD